MIQFVERYFRFEDTRGILEGLLNTGSWGELNLIGSRAGAVRGNHYHRETTEAFVMLEGEAIVTVQRVREGLLEGPAVEHRVGPGSVFLIAPGTNHVFRVTKDARWLNLLSLPMDAAAPDLHRARAAP